MSEMTTAIIIALFTSAMILAVAFILSRKLASVSGSETAELQSEIDNKSARLEELASKAKNYASKKQLNSLEQLLKQEEINLAGEKDRLKEVETRLEDAQKMVEGKESEQQELKTAHSEDEKKLQELLSAYEQISSESMSLEKKLAASLKNLEAIIAEAVLNEDQKAILTNMLNTLTEGSSRLRELITEYQAVNERLTTLNQQHKDLEDEYTKLVEQQLGE